MVQSSPSLLNGAISMHRRWHKCTRFSSMSYFAFPHPCHIHNVKSWMPVQISSSYIFQTPIFITIFSHSWPPDAIDWFLSSTRYCFDPGKIKFNTKRCFVGENRCFCFCCPIFMYLLFLCYCVTNHSTIYNHIYCFVLLHFSFITAMEIYGFNILLLLNFSGCHPRQLISTDIAASVLITKGIIFWICKFIPSGFHSPKSRIFVSLSM